MSTQLHTHISTLPKILFTDHGWFTNLKVIVTDRNGAETMFIMYLPKETTFEQVREALNGVEMEVAATVLAGSR